MGLFPIGSVTVGIGSDLYSQVQHGYFLISSSSAVWGKIIISRETWVAITTNPLVGLVGFLLIQVLSFSRKRRLFVGIALIKRPAIQRVPYWHLPLALGSRSLGSLPNPVAVCWSFSRQQNQRWRTSIQRLLCARIHPYRLSDSRQSYPNLIYENCSSLALLGLLVPASHIAAPRSMSSTLFRVGFRSASSLIRSAI